jgi:hypothetical protein
MPGTFFLGTFPYYAAGNLRALSLECCWKREANVVNSVVGNPQIGQWYQRTDNADTFQVISVDESANTIEIQSFVGDMDELDAETWASLPLALAQPQPPEDGLELMDDMGAEDVACSEAPTALERFAAASGDVAP